MISGPHTKFDGIDLERFRKFYCPCREASTDSPPLVSFFDVDMVNLNRMAFSDEDVCRLTNGV